MPQPSSEYGKVCSSFDLHRSYISDALSVIFDPDGKNSEFPLEIYEIFYFVVPRGVGENLGSSCAWYPNPGTKLKKKNIEEFFQNSNNSLNFLQFLIFSNLCRTRNIYFRKRNPARGDFRGRCFYPGLSGVMPRDRPRVRTSGFVLFWFGVSSK
jgi:hypothetical protein